MTKIVHLTTVHTPGDARIFEKECKSLAAAGYGVVLLAPGAEQRVEEGVTLKPLKRAPGRILRLTQGVAQALMAAIREKASVYHFHDPELMPAGWVLRLMGKRVLYDVHEDVPRNMLNKHYLPLAARRGVAFLLGIVEQASARVLSGIVAATPTIGARFPSSKTIVVRNYPKLSEFRDTLTVPYEERAMEVIYAGGLSQLRGCFEMVEAAWVWNRRVPAPLVISGKFASARMEEQAKRMEGWRNVDFLGWQSRDRLISRFGAARVGLVLLHPTEAFRRALPVKLFEYMAAGIPVVASDFPLWREIIEDADCGLLVDPLDPAAAANAVESLLLNPDLGARLAGNGRRAVEGKFNWARESGTLTRVYETMVPP